MSVLAEGVETAEQGDFLLKLGCEAAQGYLYGAPEPADRVVKRLPALTGPAQPTVLTP
jgi:EAL domain-containing protein (putative c-di-GMP-specific phosphodiesterase class I)